MSAAACSDEDAEPLCRAEFSAADACGGDLEGTWTVAEGCGRLGVLSTLEMQCSGIEVISEVVTSATGTLTVQGDSYTESLRLRGEVDFIIPSECLPDGATCTQVGEDLSNGFNSASTAVCIDAQDGCRCDLDAGLDRETSGTLTLSGSTVILDGGLQYFYCVDETEAEGEVLRLRAF
ncbi:MAG: hypothetical protein AAFV29_11845, partial [Myxococcota bacterium]